jgi:hypothetical protein
MGGALQRLRIDIGANTGDGRIGCGKMIKGIERQLWPERAAANADMDNGFEAGAVLGADLALVKGGDKGFEGLIGFFKLASKGGGQSGFALRLAHAQGQMGDGAPLGAVDGLAALHGAQGRGPI